MKILSFLIAIIFLLTGCAPSEKPVYTTEVGLFTPYSYFPEILNGKVKKIIEKSYLTKMVGEETVADRQLTQGDRDSIGWTNDFVLTFNEDGNVVKCDEIDENGKVLGSTVTTIENAEVIKAEYYKSDSLSGYQEIEYDTLGRLVKVEFFSPDDSLKSVQLIETDENGNIITVLINTPDANLKSKFQASYDENNKRKGYKFFDPEGNQTFEQKYTFNDHGFLETQQIINKEGEESMTSYTFKYDDKGNWIECVGSNDENRILSTREIEYYE